MDVVSYRWCEELAHDSFQNLKEICGILSENYKELTENDDGNNKNENDKKCRGDAEYSKLIAGAYDAIKPLFLLLRLSDECKKDALTEEIQHKIDNFALWGEKMILYNDTYSVKSNWQNHRKT